MAYYGFLWWLMGILTGLTKSTDHPSRTSPGGLFARRDP